MAISRVSQSTVKQGLDKSQTFTAGIPPILGKFYHMGTVEVGAGGASSIEFTGIPAIYKHLQVRAILRADGTGSPGVSIRFNSNSSSNYAYHTLSGDGSSPSAGAATSAAFGAVGVMPTTTHASGIFAAHVIDILNYSSTSKNTTTRSAAGQDFNGSGLFRLSSTLWANTSAVSGMSLFDSSGRNFAQYSTAALYGVK